MSCCTHDDLKFLYHLGANNYIFDVVQIYCFRILKTVMTVISPAVDFLN